jgi:hypothetical protein
MLIRRLRRHHRPRSIAAGGLVAYAAWANIERRRTDVTHTARAGSRLADACHSAKTSGTTGYAVNIVHGTIRTRCAMPTPRSRRGIELRFIYASSWPRAAFSHTAHTATALPSTSRARALGRRRCSRGADRAVGLFGCTSSFDRTGRSGSYRIDFEAMALHLQALARAARGHGIGIRRVIFDTELQPLLFATEHGGQLRRQMSFNKTQSWVRHDEHYHVDFDVSCD